MPGLRLHMTIARDLACAVGAPVVDAERGAYFLGATTPDIRAMTRWDRERTHFFSLDEFGEQSGVHRLFEQEQRLRDASALDAPTAAFMAGYISHLVLDEEYITQIYRPLFGEHSALRDEASAGVMDKMIQWDVERADWQDAARADEIRTALAETAVAVNIDVIAAETLSDWRKVTLDVIAQPLTVERLVRFLGRRLPEFHLEDEAQAARFADEVPAMLQRTWEHVGQERMREYLHSAKSRARAAIEEYLS